MTNGVASPVGCTDIQTFVRNRYFYGKLLDVEQFDMEQTYVTKKRWLLNRLVTGYGVICGLNVGLSEDCKQLWVGPGIALDKAGREIVVPVRSQPIAIPERPPETERKTDDDDDCNVASVSICYHECPGDPEPVHANDCDEPSLCATGSIRERYQVHIWPRKAPKIDAFCEVPDLLVGGRLNYAALANYVTADCPEEYDDPCIALANITLPKSGETICEADIDISIRPIVYTNDLLFELMLGLTSQTQNRPRGGKS